MYQQIEEWKPIIGYEGYYEISTHGKVKSFKRGGERLLKATLNTKGYPRVTLLKDGVFSYFMVHRIVGMNFIPNPEGKAEINHIDGIKSNCNVSNLEWSTRLENAQHASKNNLMSSVLGVNYKPSLRANHVMRTIAPEAKIKASKENYYNSRIYMKITLKPVLWTKDIDKSGRSPIAISITGAGKRTYYNTGIKVKPDHWENGIIKKECPNFDILNNRLSGMIKDAEREILNKELQGLPIDLNYVKEFLNPGGLVKSKDYYKYAEKIIALKNPATKRRYTVELDKLKEYAGAKLTFADITPKWLTAYHKHLLKINNPNTAINAFKVIRHVFNEAIEAKDITFYPFNDWKYPQYKAPKRSYLTVDECEELFKLLDRKDIGKDMKLVTAFFLLECYAGLRVSDWGKFSVEKVVRNNDMVFTTTKTGTDVRLPLDLMPSLNRVVDYISNNKLQYTQTGEFANELLKFIAPLAGIEKRLHTHLARHTFATQCLSIGMSKESIAAAMGITSKQVETYAKIMPDKMRNELTRLGGGV